MPVVGSEQYELILHFHDGTVFDEVWARMQKPVNCAEADLYPDDETVIDFEPICDDSPIEYGPGDPIILVLPCLIIAA